MIVATAGHVDHGKTTLVKALTGVDTDRTAEEKRRGMSIDLGFAYADFGAGSLLGFVDVPGHERFVRNMLAGVASIDLALLVIAADDGPMPQTREHLAMLDLLGVAQTAIALTKIDRVTPQRVEEAKAEVAAMLEAVGRGGAALFPLSVPERQGLAPLREFLAQRNAVHAARGTQGHFRLAIDRAFSVTGAGLVVTGAVLSGECREGDTLVVSPQGVPVRVRGIHSHNRPAGFARAGERCAINLAGSDLKRADIGRGDWLVAPPVHAPTARLDTRLRLLASEGKPLADGTLVHLHLGAAVRQARVGLLEAAPLAPGATAWAQLVLDTPVHAVHGDRFVLRDASGQRTLGGGVVVEPEGVIRGRAKPQRMAHLAAMNENDHATALTALLACEPGGVGLEGFTCSRNLTSTEAQPLYRALGLHLLEDGDARSAVAGATWTTSREAMLGALGDWHAQRPDSLGPSETELATALGWRASAPLFRAAARSLVDQQLACREGLRLRLPAHRPVLATADAALLERITGLLAAAGQRPPIVGELAKQLAVTLPVLLLFLQRATDMGHLVRVAKNRWFLPATIEALAALARDLCVESPESRFDAAVFRDRSGLGRNLSIELLEFFDRSRITRFDEARRAMAPR